MNYEICSPHPKDLAEQDSIDGVDRAVDSSSQRAQQHVGPFWLVVLEDTCHWGGLNMFIWTNLMFLLKNGTGNINFLSKVCNKVHILQCIEINLTRLTGVMLMLSNGVPE